MNIEHLLFFLILFNLLGYTKRIFHEEQISIDQKSVKK